jgi:hypothetical protein
LRPDVEPGRDDRVNAVIVRGSLEYAAWLTELHKKTRLQKSTIVRMALAEWAEKRGFTLPPEI